MLHIMNIRDYLQWNTGSTFLSHDICISRSLGPVDDVEHHLNPTKYYLLRHYMMVFRRQDSGD